MVLNRAYFDKSWKSLQNSLKIHLSSWKWISNTSRDYLWRFGVNWRVSKIYRFWAKGLGPCLWTWRILANPGNRSKLPETHSKFLNINFLHLAGLSVSIWGELAMVENWPILSKSPFLAHGFEHGGYWQVLKIAPKSLKRHLSAWKWISNTSRDYLCRFGVNWRGSILDRFLGKGLGYSPWFWTWRILTSPGNLSKLPETHSKGLIINFWHLPGLSTICHDLGWIGEGRK